MIRGKPERLGRKENNFKYTGLCPYQCSTGIRDFRVQRCIGEGHSERERGVFNLIQGDWNAKVLMDMPSSMSTGQFRIGSANESEEKLVHLALENNLKIVNTFFNKPERRKWTWKSPNGITKNKIDHSFVDDLRRI